MQWSFQQVYKRLLFTQECAYQVLQLSLTLPIMIIQTHIKFTSPDYSSQNGKSFAKQKWKVLKW